MVEEKDAAGVGVDVDPALSGVVLLGDLLRSADEEDGFGLRHAVGQSQAEAGENEKRTVLTEQRCLFE